MKSVLGILGGSGVYDLPGLADPVWREVESPWGEPSDAILHAALGDLPVRFLPRHGRGHRLSPSHIDYRANIDALKRAGVTDLVSVSAVGSLREDFAPGAFVLPDQFVDRTFARQTSFFGEGVVAHVSMARPVSPRLVERLAEAAAAEGIEARSGGACVVIEGPQFSTLAESRLYRAWGCDLIGMTAMPEAKLAREAELSYAMVAMVTDYDAWHADHEAVDAAAVIKVLEANRAKVQALLLRLAKHFPRRHEPCPVGSDRALDGALMTAPEKRDPALVTKLDAVAGRVLGGA